MINTNTMGSSRQLGNQAKLGFCPTDERVVQLELDLLDLSELRNNEVPINVCDLTGGTGEQLNIMHRHLEEYEVNHLCYYNELSKVRYEEAKRKYPYFIFSNKEGDVANLRIFNKNGEKYSRKVFGIIRDNPPYGTGSLPGTRLEKQIFDRNVHHAIEGSIHIYEIPYGQIESAHRIAGILQNHEICAIAKFPKEFQRYNQVVLICRLRKNITYNRKRFEEIKTMIETDTMPYLDELIPHSVPVFLDDLKKSPKIDVFRDNSQTDKTRQKSIEDCLDELINDEMKSSIIRPVLRERPLIAPSPGHMSSLITSGRYDGIMGNFLIKGGTKKIKKEIQTLESEDKIVVDVIDVVIPFLEITNKKGDVHFVSLDEDD